MSKTIIYYVLFTRGTRESELNPVGKFRNIPVVVIVIVKKTILRQRVVNL